MEDTDNNSVPNIAVVEDDALDISITGKWYVDGNVDGDQMPVMVLAVVDPNTKRVGLRLMLTPTVVRKLQSMSRLFLEPFEETYGG
jgi:hypothetical protein